MWQLEFSKGGTGEEMHISGCPVKPIETSFEFGQQFVRVGDSRGKVKIVNAPVGGSVLKVSCVFVIKPRDGDKCPSHVFVSLS